MTRLEQAVQRRDSLLEIVESSAPPPGTDPVALNAELEQSRSAVASLSTQYQQLEDSIAAEAAAIHSATRLESLAREADALSASIADADSDVSRDRLQSQLVGQMRALRSERTSFERHAAQSGLIPPRRFGALLGGSLLYLLTPYQLRAPVRSGSDGLPALLPWPPPTASGFVVLPRDLVRSRLRRNQRLAAVDAQIRNALSRSGYGDASYYGAPGGFAIATRVERIDREGTPLAGEARWSTNVPPLREFTLEAYLRALFAAESGYFRVFLIVVSNTPFRPDPARARFAHVVNWSSSGLNVLPSDVGNRPLTAAHDVTVLIYEFTKTRGARTGASVVPGRWSATHHLLKSRLQRSFLGR